MWNLKMISSYRYNFSFLFITACFLCTFLKVVQWDNDYLRVKGSNSCHNGRSKEDLTGLPFKPNLDDTQCSIII